MGLVRMAGDAMTEAEGLLKCDGREPCIEEDNERYISFVKLQRKSQHSTQSCTQHIVA